MQRLVSFEDVFLLPGCLLDVYWPCVQTDGQLFRNASVHDMMSFKEPFMLWNCEQQSWDERLDMRLHFLVYMPVMSS